MTKKKKLLIFLALIAIIVLASTLFAHGDDFNEIKVRAEVISVEDSGAGESVYFESIENVSVKVTESGPYKGQEYTVENAKTGNPGMDLNVKPGDRIILLVHLSNGQVTDTYIEDHYRMPMIYLLGGIFVLLILVIGRMKGLRSLITLVISIGLTVLVLVPQAIEGRNPILLSIIISVVAIITTFIIVGGLNKKSMVAILGTAGGIILGGLLAAFFSSYGNLSGMSLQESQMLMYAPVNVVYDFRGLLLASIIIGSLGAIMDVGMSIASSMHEVKERAPEITKGELLKAGLNIGQDIMGTMVNTLILAYAGASLPLLMIFKVYEMPLGTLLNMDLMATEIVRALAGSIGLIICIPLTAFFAVMLYDKKDETV
jgi:uncharacterized membrane protein